MEMNTGTEGSNKKMAERRIYSGAGGSSSSSSGGGGSNLRVLVQDQSQTVLSCSDSIFLSGSSPFLGSRSMMSFQDNSSRGNRSTRPFFEAFDQEENRDDDDDEEYFHQPGKKRRLTVNQVEFLEKSFDVDNKLDPERKTLLAKELGLQPRQIAIWFQNRRARWKTKQLEKDYDVLQASYNSLKTDFDNLVQEKDKLKYEVTLLSDKLMLRGKQDGISKLSNPKENWIQESPETPLVDSTSEGEMSKVSTMVVYKPEDNCSVKNDIFDSSYTPHYTDGVQSPILEAGDSSYVFEADQQSDISQEEDDNLSKTLFPHYIFPKLEDIDYSDPPSSFCNNFGSPIDDDQAFWSWSY